MNPDSILHAEMLDIIFENRNKEYGAYELRTRYPKRLKIALEIMLLTVMAFCFFLFIDAYFFHRLLTKRDLYEIPDINLAPPSTRKVLEVAKPKTAKSPTTSVKTVPFNNFKIVSVQPAKPIPTAAEIDAAQIGSQSIPGDSPSGVLLMQSGNGKAAGMDVKSDSAASPILATSQIMPEFPGGMEALIKYLRNNLHTPLDMEPGTKVKVLEKFVVDNEGNISNVRIIQGGGLEFDNEVLRVLRKMPRWKPGKQNGINVSVYFTIPVIFQGQEDN